MLYKEITGFLLNRIQGTVLNEMPNLYADGYASVENLDKVMRDAPAMRWAVMRPFETIDLNAPEGVVDYAARSGPTYKEAAAGREWRSIDYADRVCVFYTSLQLDKVQLRSRL